MLSVIDPHTVDTIGRRYLLHERLGEGGMGVVHRATDRLAGRDVALKRVLRPAEHLLFASRQEGRQESEADLPLALAWEFQTLATLRHPNIISVLDYGFDAQRRPYFTMDLLAGARNILEAGAAQPLAVQVDLLVQILQALAYLHRRGILHRDLKPANVLVQAGQARLVDFGLSVAAEHAGGRTGTLAYMAPEVLDRQAASVAADLYSVGMIACELLTGRYPFDTSSRDALMDDILDKTPEVNLPGGAAALADIVGRLLAKVPEARYPDANQVIAALCAAADLAVPPETQAIRESFLQAARLVGRAPELALLSEALSGALQGHGSSWLVGGESGVGKSRLLDELRTLALVQGAWVLVGQSVSEGRRPYMLWRDIVRWLALQTELSDLEAGVLKTLAPDLDALLERSVPVAPEVDRQATLERLVGVIEAMFRRQKQPVVLILEDLQWATEGMDVLTRLNHAAPDLPLLILGSYRDDERLDLPALLPEMRLLKLERLNTENIARLSESMLGPNGLQPPVLGLLQRETEGNVFFLVEVVRALAEETGRLDRIGLGALPEHVFAGGVQRIIQRRLNRVSESARALLQLAAVAGRQLDLAVLGRARPEAELAGWLGVCADAAILEVRDGAWRFTHDRLREGLLDDLPAGLRQNLHRSVAASLEAIYGRAPEYLAALAHHWAGAGELKREMEYAGLAGQYAFTSGAYQESISFLERALALHGPLGADLAATASIEHQIGEASYALGRMPEARRHLERALALYGHDAPQSPLPFAAALFGQFMQQTARRLTGGALAQSSRQGSAMLLKAAQVWERLAQIYYLWQEKIPAINAAIRSLNLAEEADPSPMLARGYANMCVAAGLAPGRPFAEVYHRRARATARRLGDRPTLAYALMATSLYDVGLGRWEAARDGLNQAIQIAQQVKEPRREAECWGALARVVGLQGDIRLYAGLCAEMLARGRHRGDIQEQLWGLNGHAMAILWLGETDRAVALLEEALSLLARNPDRFSETVSYGVLATAHFRRGDRQAARRAAETGASLIARSSPTVMTSIDGYAGVAETFLRLWENAGADSPSERRALAEATRRSCRALRGFAAGFPIGQPYAWLCTGLHAWLRGRSGAAHRAWGRSLRAATRLTMPYEQGLAHLEIALHLPSQDSTRTPHLERARQIFADIGAVYDLARCESALH